MQTQTNANKQVVSKSAKRRQRQRKRANATGVVPATKSVRQSRQSNQNQRVPRRRNRRGRSQNNGPLGSDWNPRNRTLGGIFETMDPFGAGWEEKSGMLGVGNTRGIRQSRRDMVIEESEFVTAVTVANQPNFNNVAFPINPGQATLFPWLSTIAKQFERYHFEKLSFIFKKEVSEFNTAGAAGKIIMSVDFDASDAPPGTKQQMEDTIPHADAMPCQSFSLPMDPRDLNAQNTLGRYVRTGGLPGAADIKTYDVGNLNVATQGVPSNVEIGELHVAYRIRLIKPVLENLAAAPANNQVTLFQGLAVAITPSGNDTQIPLATAVVNGLLAVNTAGSIVLPPGNYIVDACMNVQNATQITQTACKLLKNAAVISAVNSSTVGAASVTTDSTVTVFPCFFSSNGTDALTMNIQVTYTGAPTYDAVLRILAV